MEDFYRWKASIDSDIHYVLGALSKPLSDEPEELIHDLMEIEAWNARMGTHLADANSWLDIMTVKLLPTKEGKTESERKAIVDAETSNFRKLRDILESLCNSIKQRLILGESILSYYKNVFSEKKALDKTKDIF